jgi:hypothetical protein
MLGIKKSASKSPMGRNATSKSLISRNKSPMAKKTNTSAIGKRSIGTPMKKKTKVLDPVAKAIQLENDYLKNQVAALQ